MKLEGRPLAWAVFVLLLGTACASDPVKRNARISEQIAQATANVQNRVESEYQLGHLPRPDYLAAQAAFIKIADGILLTNQCLRALDTPGAAAQIKALLELVAEFIEQQPAAKLQSVKASLDAFQQVLAAIQTGGA